MFALSQICRPDSTQSLAPSSSERLCWEAYLAGDDLPGSIDTTPLSPTPIFISLPPPTTPTRRYSTFPPCLVCGTISTPEWRKGPFAGGKLCNADGLVYAQWSKSNPAAAVLLLSNVAVGSDGRREVNQVCRILETIGRLRFEKQGKKKKKSGTGRRFRLPVGTRERVAIGLGVQVEEDIDIDIDAEGEEDTEEGGQDSDVSMKEVEEKEDAAKLLCLIRQNKRACSV